MEHALVDSVSVRVCILIHAVVYTDLFLLFVNYYISQFMVMHTILCYNFLRCTCNNLTQ